jgi:hypothetical protein
MEFEAESLIKRLSAFFSQKIGQSFTVLWEPAAYILGIIWR